MGTSKKGKVGKDGGLKKRKCRGRWGVKRERYGGLKGERGTCKKKGLYGGKYTLLTTAFFMYALY